MQPRTLSSRTQHRDCSKHGDSSQLQRAQMVTLRSVLRPFQLRFLFPAVPSQCHVCVVRSFHVGVVLSILQLTTCSKVTIVLCPLVSYPIGVDAFSRWLDWRQSRLPLMSSRRCSTHAAHIVHQKNRTDPNHLSIVHEATAHQIKPLVV